MNTVPNLSGEMMQQTAIHPIHIDLPEGYFEAELELSVHAERLVVFAYKIMGISSVVADMGIRAAERLGIDVSCKKGCAACCRQLVPLSPPEAAMIFEFVQTMPEPRKTIITKRFLSALQRLEEKGLLTKLACLKDPMLNDEEYRAITQSYFYQQIACPFLENECCSIYEVRPSICREYLVASPAEHCRNPYEKKITKVPVSIRLSYALANIWSACSGKRPQLIPFIQAIQYTDAHEATRSLTVKSQPLVKALLEQIQKSVAFTEKEYVDVPRDS